MYALGVIFKTPRLIIRPWTLEDAGAALRMYGDREVMRYLGRDRPGVVIESLEEMRERLGRAIERYLNSPKGYVYAAVALRESGEVIGTALLKSLELSNGSASEDEIEIGWHFARAHWGKGFGTELGAALVKHGFGRLGLTELHAVAYHENVASLRIMQKIGMTHLESTDRYYGVTLEHYVIQGPV